MFAPNAADLEYLFESAGETVLINDVERQVIITNPAINENEERYIHTLFKVAMGDMVTIDNEKFLIINETISKRGAKYKTLVRHCNFYVEVAGEVTEIYIGDNDFGEPMYETVQGEPIQIASIIDNQSFSVVNGAITLATNQINVIVQDNEMNRIKFTVNGTFNVMDKNWKVLNQDRTKKGLLHLTCEVV